MADLATLVYDIDSSQAAGAAKALIQMERAAASADSAAARLDKTYRGANGQFVATATVAKENEREIRRLAATYNTGLAAQLGFADAQREVARAVQLGVIPASEQEAVIRRLEIAYAKGGVAAQVYGTSTNRVTSQIQNAGYQVGDFAVQIASGQNAMMALSQQLPQLLGGFGALGAVLGAGTAIAGAFFMAMGAGKSEADKLAASIDKVSGAVDELRALNRSFSVSAVEELRSKYGEVDATVRSLLESQRTYNQLVASKELKDSLETIQGFASGNWWDLGLSNAVGGVLNLQSAFNLTRNDAESLQYAIDQVGKAEGYAAQIAALQTVSDYMKIILTNSEDVTTEQLEQYKAINDALDATKQLQAAAGEIPGAFDAATAAARRITDELQRATNAAARLANSAISDQRMAQINLDFRTDEVGRAGALAAAKFDEEVGKNTGMDAGLFNRMRAQAIAGAEEAARIQAEVERLNKADRDAERENNRGAKQAERELKAAEKGFQTIRELLEKEGIFQFAEWEKRQAQLDEALKKQLLTEQQYMIMKQQLQQNYFGVEYQQNALRYQMDLDQLKAARDAELLTEQQYMMRRAQLQNDYYSGAITTDQNATAQQLSQMSAAFGQMNSLAGGGYNKLIKAQQTFAAGSALINAYLAATQALADPSVPFWGKAAAYAKTLAAGLGAVNAIKGGGSGGGGGRGSSAAAAATRTEPQRQVLVRLQGDDWLVGMAETIMDEIYKQSADGRVVVVRDN